MLSPPIEAAIILRFLNSFCVLESTVKKIFDHHIKELLEDNNRIEQQKKFLFFKQALLVKKNIEVNFSTDQVNMGRIKYHKFEGNPSQMSMSQILTFCQANNLIPAFNLEIKSINNPMNSYEFYPCCKKLIKMRNNLCHETSNCNFRETDAIELLSETTYKDKRDPWLETFTYDDISDNQRLIFSNYIFIDSIVDLLG
jgi:hypothetical protein